MLNELKVLNQLKCFMLSQIFIFYNDVWGLSTGLYGMHALKILSSIPTDKCIVVKKVNQLLMSEMIVING